MSTSGDGERNDLTLVALVIALISVIAFTAGFIVWHHHAGLPRVAESRVEDPSPPIATTVATATTTTTTETAIATATAAPLDSSELANRILEQTRRRPSSMSTTAPSDTGAGDIPNAQATLARMRSGFRYCYNKGLATDPSLHGSITLAITVAPSGEVTGVTKKTGGLVADVDDCLVRRAKAASFDASPKGGTVNVPLTFAQAN